MPYTLIHTVKHYLQLTSQKLTLNKQNDVWVKCEKVKDEQ